MCLSDDIREQLALELHHLVLDGEFALLEALDLNLIERRGFGHGADRLVQITVFGAQFLQLHPQLIQADHHWLTISRR